MRASATVIAVLTMLLLDSSLGAVAQEASRRPEPLLGEPAAENTLLAAFGCRRPCRSPCSPAVANPAPAAVPGAAPGAAQTPAPSAPAPEEPALEVPPGDFLAGDFGAAPGPESAAPNMIGDFLGLTLIPLTASGSPFSVEVPTPGGAVGRFKMAENTSPRPKDRVYGYYALMHNVPISGPVFAEPAGQQIDVNAFVVGFEKTFLCDAASVEVRLPMASTLSSDVIIPTGSPVPTPITGELGNLGVALKLLVVDRPELGVSAGLAMNFATADDVTARLFPDTPVFRIENESVHFLPFVGALWTPNERLFAQGYLQVDVDANGNPIFVNSDGVEFPLGRFTDQTLMYLDLGGGYWFRRCADDRLIKGVAAITELHLTQSVSTSDEVGDGTGIIQAGVRGLERSMLDLTVGLHLEVLRRSDLTLGYVVPLTSDRDFDGELRVLVNWNF